LREMPHVVGAFVQPDAFGHPREIHLLIRPGPKPREFAQEVKTLLETRLRVPIDQRIISIAQLAAEGAPEPPAEPERDGRAVQPEPTPVPPRVRLENVETRVRGGRVTVAVALQFDDAPLRGEATEFEAEEGRARAGARATLEALNTRIEGRGRFGLEFAATVEALDHRYVLVSATAVGAALGRRPVALAGAHTADEPEETAAVLAALKATNRALEALLAEEAPPRRRRGPSSEPA
ncbi:MAG: hypothetical protein PVH00_07580, partial [Gemmatimonadota bacterium]